MKYPKILLTGGTGQVGYELQNYLKELGNIWAPKREEFNLIEPEALRSKIYSFKPNLIVNAAAFTSVESAESEPKLAYLINRDAPKVMAEEAYRLNIPLIHYSTDYVFDGNKVEPYTESDQPNPINVYGKSKLGGESAIRATHDQYLILRTSWVYSRSRGKNFYQKMLELFHEKEKISVVNDQIGAPTSAQFLAKETSNILAQLKQKEDGENRWGLYHISENEPMSWYTFAEKLFNEAKQNSPDLKLKLIQPISSDELKTKAKRPRNSVFSLQSINENFELTDRISDPDKC